MFFDFFGLERNPFRSRVSGSDVFVGPQQATLIGGLKKALTGGDAVVTVTGPVGVGKTTVVNRALSEISASARVARIGRIRLRREDVPELLLAELGAERQPASTVQQFAELRRLLNQCADEDVRVFIVVEDAQRIGADVLAEIESLTSADSGDAPGAHVILMGQPDLHTMLREPALARLRQRVLLRQSVESLSSAEVRGYLAHSLRQAGGSIDALFAGDAIEAVRTYSDGIPRVINSLLQAAMTVAADAEVRRVGADHVQSVAQDEFGLEPMADARDAGEPADMPTTTAAASEAPPAEEFDVPELIQDTQPEMEALKLPEEPTEGIRPQDLAPLRDKTDETQPSLPVLTIPDLEELPAEDAAALAAEKQRIQLEPREPEPLTNSDPADTQTIRALDSALRPDTQLLEALDEPPPPIEDDAEVPLGLQGQVQAPVSGTQTLPTLSESMRLDAPPKPAPIPPDDSPAGPPDAGAKKPNIDKLEAALAIARRGPIDLSTDGEAPATQEPTTAPASASAAAPATPEAPSVDLPDPSMVPEITLDAKIQKHKDEARARLAEEAEKLAEQKAEKEAAKKAAVEAAKPKPHPAEVDFGSIGDQLSSDEALTAPPTERTDETGRYATLDATADEPAGDPAERQKLEKLAEDLGNATSIEDIDDMAAETLFGEEFSEIAAQVAAMAANDMVHQADDGDEAVGEPMIPGQPGADAAAVDVPAAEPSPPPPGAASPSPAATATPAPPAPGTTRPTQNPQTPAGTAPPPIPPTQPDLDSSAARRLEMVRSLNQSKAPPAAPPTVPSDNPEEIVLGNQDNSPTYSGPAPEPIENQFGTSMTATLKALSETSMNAIPKDEVVEVEEKKGGLLSRFKRS